MGTKIRWLHLTDLHVGMEDQDWLWPKVGSKFRDDLKKLYDAGGPWDLVLFTGDLVQKGTEFDRLDTIFDDLWGWFAGLKCNPKLLTIPGNHDLQWRDSKDAVVKQLYRWETDADVSTEFWNSEDSQYRKTVNDAFATYDTWWRNTPRKPDGVRHGLLPGDFSYTFTKDGFRLGIVGLNSAFLQLTEKRGRRKFDGHMALHPRQFHEACGDDRGAKWAESHHACFLMTHHPPDWLNKESQEQFHGEIIDHFQLHLCGHNHETDVLQELTGGTEFAALRWQGRSLFGLEKSSGGKLDRSHGYISGELRLSDDFQGELQFMPRERRTQGKGWSIVSDHDVQLPDDRCTRAFPIPVCRLAIKTATSDDDSVTSGGDQASPAMSEHLLPKVVCYLRELPDTQPDLHEEVITALHQEMPLTGSRDTTDLIELAGREGVNELLDALYRWLDRSTRTKLSSDGWREVLTHLVVLAAAKPDWLSEARLQEKKDGLVSVGERLQPFSAAVLISGLFDIAIRLDDRKPAGHIPVGRGRGSKGHDSQDRYNELIAYLRNEYRKFVSPDSDALDEAGIKEMLIADRMHNNPRFVCLPEGDKLGDEIGKRLRGLVTVLQEKDAAGSVLDQSLRLVRNIQELLDKLKRSS